MSKSPFGLWFRQQAGKPPMTDAQYLKLRNDTIPSLRHQLIEAEASLARMESYRTAHQYALYAWTARERQDAEGAVL